MVEDKDDISLHGVPIPSLQIYLGNFWIYWDYLTTVSGYVFNVIRTSKNNGDILVGRNFTK
jgi:hypothetical protein